MNELTRCPRCESDHTQKVFLVGDWVNKVGSVLVSIVVGLLIGYDYKGRKLDFDSWKCQQCLHTYKVPKDLGDVEAPTES